MGVKSRGEGIVGIRSVFLLLTRCCVARTTVVPREFTSPSSPDKMSRNNILLIFLLHTYGSFYTAILFAQKVTSKA
jgi:hypothetical protein